MLLVSNFFKKNVQDCQSSGTPNWQPCTSHTPTVLTDAQGGKLYVKQAIQLTFTVQDRTVVHILHVLSNLKQDCILGIDFITKYVMIVGPAREVHINADPHHSGLSWASLAAHAHAKTIVLANSHAKVLCQVRPPAGTKFIPGVTVLAHQSEIDDLHVVNGLYKMLNRNAVCIVVSNHSRFDLVE